MTEKKKIDVYAIVTEKIIEQLEKGKIPWRIPWEYSQQQNLVSKHAYRGVNIILTSAAAMTNGWKSPYWLTFNQARKIGAKVKKGSKATLVTFWKILKFKDKDKNTGEDTVKVIPFLRYYNVFNVEQCELPENWEKKIADLKADHEEISDCEEITKGYLNNEKLKMVHDDMNRAFYSPIDDFVNVPPLNSFKKREEYYSTVFHELAHSTGNPKRLKRFDYTEKINPFGSQDYSKEELVAEITAAMLCGITEIEQKTIKNSAAYIQNWLNVLQDDRKFFVQAAGKAQKAADYILGTTVEDSEEE